jgi:hypothetical protein
MAISAKSAGPKNLVEAVQLVFEALEPFDEAARQRILSSAVSLLGGTVAPASVSSQAHRSAPVQAPVPSSVRPLTPLEVIEQKAPATNAQRLAVFAYYREKVEGIARFSKDDLRTYFAKAKQPPPGNFDRDYQLAVSLGWTYNDGADSYLTSKGLEAVEAGFGGKRQPPTSKKSKAKRKNKKK